MLEIINTKKRTAPQMARALLVLIKRFFGWCVDQEIYGLSTSPCEGLSGKKLIGELQSRDRRLSDAELFAFWRATGRMGYPTGSVYRMLLLTGLRLNEAAQISWPEVQGNTIVIPASRMKGREGKAREHLVPMSAAAAGGHRIAAAHQERAVPVLHQRGQASIGDDRPDQGRSGPAHAADLEGDWPAVAARIITPSICRDGSTTICAASFAPVCRHCASRTTSRKPCLRTGHPASSAPTTFMSMRTRRPRRWRSGRSACKSIVNPPAKVPDKKIVPLRKRRR